MWYNRSVFCTRLHEIFVTSASGLLWMLIVLNWRFRLTSVMSSWVEIVAVLPHWWILRRRARVPSRIDKTFLKLGPFTRLTKNEHSCPRESLQINKMKVKTAPLKIKKSKMNILVQGENDIFLAASPLPTQRLPKTECIHLFTHVHSPCQ